MHGTWPIMLNPGPSYVLKHCDVCFYMNIAKEENSTFLPATSSVSASQSAVSGQGVNLTALNQQLLPMQMMNTDNKNGDDVECLKKNPMKNDTEHQDSIEKPDTHLLSTDYNLGANSGGGGGSAFSFSNLRRKSSSFFSSENSAKPRRDSSPTRLKRAVTDFATKVKRVTTGRHLGHLDVPKIEFGSPATKSNDVVAARGRRPSIAPVPAMLGDNSTTETSEDESEDEEDSSPTASTNHKEQTKDNGKEKEKESTERHPENQWTFPTELSV